MNNDNIELFKLLQINQYELNREKSEVLVTASGDMIAHIHIKASSRDCPYCSSVDGATIHSTNIRQIYHPILPSKNVFLYFHQLKFKCKYCGHLFVQYNPISRERHNISIMGEMKILERLKNPRTTFKDISDDFGIPITSIIRCFNEHVQIKRHKLTEVMCFDEIYSKKLTDTKYAFSFIDPHTGTILDILDARRKNVLSEYFSRIPYSERSIVKYICIDMYQTYKDIALQAFPNVTIAVDSFHVIEHLNSAMDKIRIRVEKRYIDPDNQDKNDLYWLLKNFHYYFTENFDKIKYTRKPNSNYSYLWDKHQVLNKLYSIDEELTKAHKLKVEYQEFNLCRSFEEAKDQIDDFIERFKESPFEEFRDFGRMIERWKQEIINSHIIVNGKRLSNGPMESINGRIRRILFEAYGYTNFPRFRNRIMYSLNENEPITNF